jgi:hypothetical protein
MVKQSDTEAERRGNDRRKHAEPAYTGPERRQRDRRTMGAEAADKA